jgi:SAM-dependent methyltransferase
VADPVADRALLGRIAEHWDRAAGAFDAEADHGLRDPLVRAAWADRLKDWLPAPPADVLDLGCGTGSLALLAAEAGHRVVGVDLSPRMVELARAKLALAPATVLVGDAAAPPVGGRTFDVVLVRHLVWTLPEPDAALRRWVGLLRRPGRIVLVEGRWAGAGDPAAYVAGAERLPWPGGVGADDLAGMLAPLVARWRVEALTHPGLWGRAVADERYALIGDA